MSASRPVVAIGAAFLGLSIGACASAPAPQPVDPRIPQPSSGREAAAQGQRSGLSFGGQGGLGAEIELTTFCCPAYAQMLLETIDREWNRRGSRGVVKVQFTIERDGTISRPQWYQKSGIVTQDVEALRAVQTIRMPPLPAEFPDRQLTIRLTFNYGGQQ
jgi:TonB family protein